MFYVIILSTISHRVPSSMCSDNEMMTCERSESGACLVGEIRSISRPTILAFL